MEKGKGKGIYHLKAIKISSYPLDLVFCITGCTLLTL